MKTNKSNLVIILCTLFFSLSIFAGCYLIALSSRYQPLDRGYFLDSWKKGEIVDTRDFD